MTRQRRSCSSIGPAQIRQKNREHVEIDQRCGEGLGRCHADLRSGLHRNEPVGKPHGLRADRIHDGPQDGALAARFLHGREGVDRFSGLADGEHDRVLIDDGVAVAELRCDLHLDGNARDALDQNAAHHARVRGGAAGRDDDLLDAPCQFGREVELGQTNAAGFEIDAAGNGVGKRADLLVNLLGHEMAVLAFFSGDGIPGDGVSLVPKRLAFEALQCQPVARYHGELARFEEDDAAGVVENRRHVRGDKHLALAAADHHAAGVANACCDDFVRFERRHDDNAVRAFQMAERFAHRLHQPEAARKIALDQVDDRLRVGLRLEDRALVGEFLAQVEVILHNAVVDHDHLPGVADVWMGVPAVGHPVGGPTGVADPDLAMDGRTVHQGGQASKFTGIAADLYAAILQHGQAGRIIAAIFQSSEAVQDDRCGILRADVSHDSAHENPSVRCCS